MNLTAIKMTVSLLVILTGCTGNVQSDKDKSNKHQDGGEQSINENTNNSSGDINSQVQNSESQNTGSSNSNVNTDQTSSATNQTNSSENKNSGNGNKNSNSGANKNNNNRNEPQTAGQCSRTPSAGLAAFSLNMALAKTRKNPPTVIISTDKGSCTGVLSISTYTAYVNYLNDGSLNGPIKFPRITVSRHCFNQTFKSLKKLKLTSTSDTSQAIEYEIQADGSTVIKESGKKGFWYLDPVQFDQKFDKLICTRNLSGDQANRIPCFSNKNDQIVLKALDERDYVKPHQKADNEDLTGLGGAYITMDLDLYKKSKGNFINLMSKAENDKLDLVRLYADKALRTIGAVQHSDDWWLAKNIKNADELYSYLNKSLKAIYISRLIAGKARTSSDELLMITKPADEKGWQNVLEIIAEDIKGHFYIRALRLKLDKQHSSFATIDGALKQWGLTYGDSGTLLVGEFEIWKKPFITVDSFSQYLGMLSTVGNDEVCTGDDLLCCEKSG